MSNEPPDLVAAYFGYVRTHDDALFWAWQTVCVEGFDDKDEKRAQILALLAQARTRHELGLVAAGPLENLIRHHRLSVLDQIEAEALGNLRLRIALHGVWLDDTPDGKAIAERLAAVAPTDTEPDDSMPPPG